MKPASPALIALLATRQFFSADLYQFDLVGGTTLRYCSGDADIVWDGFTWSSGRTGAGSGPFFDRKDNKAKCTWEVGISVDTLTFDCIPGGGTVAGVPILTALRNGVFDGATMTLYKTFMPTYGNIAAGVTTMFSGLVAEVDVSRSLATFSVNSHLELLNQPFPRNLYQNGCSNTLYDKTCTLLAANFTEAGAAATGSTAGTVNMTLTGATGLYSLGYMTFTSGANAGFSRTINTYTKGAPGSAVLTAPFPNAPATGDTFSIYQGCDKQSATCQNKFANLTNFRGFPYIPSPETAV